MCQKLTTAFLESAEGREWPYKIFYDQSPRKNVADLGGGWTRDLLVYSRTTHPTEPPRPAENDRRKHFMINLHDRFFFCFLGFYGPFKNISLISSRSFIEGGRKPENPEKNHLTIRKQNLAFPHISTKECCRPRQGLNPRPPGLQSDGASNWATEAGQSDVKISKSFQIKTQYAYVRRYPNWYTKLKSCPLMYITDWIPIYIVSARAKRPAKYIIYVRSMYIV